MRRLLVLSLAGSLLVLTASAQYDPRRGDGRYPDRDDYGRGRGGGPFDRVRADLDRAESASYPNGGDRHRFNKVREELNEFARSGRPGELNEAISALQKVVNKNRLSYQDREVLNQDLYQLRDVRARQGYR
jgi:hypothetical protein